MTRYGNCHTGLTRSCCRGAGHEEGEKEGSRDLPRQKLSKSTLCVFRHIFSTSRLEQRLGVDSIDTYLYRRQLRWLGHVSRMDYAQRLPRLMLSSWVPHPRPRGAPPMTYGRSVSQALDAFHIDRHSWASLAADQTVWRETLRLGHTRQAGNRRRRRRPSRTVGVCAPQPSSPTATSMHRCAPCAPGDAWIHGYFRILSNV